MENIIVSACLLGVKCRYNGGGEVYDGMKELLNKYHLVPVCPEILGGLGIPRTPAECTGDKVITCEGVDVTDAYLRGANQTLNIAKLYNAKTAVLKERSPSCGCERVYDGSFSKTLINGHGVTAKLLLDNGIHIIGESGISKLLNKI